MRETRSIVAIAVLALVVALVAGIGVVAAKGTPTPNVDTIVLYSGDDGIVQGFDLQNKDKDEMSISVVKDLLTDLGGGAVGEHDWLCGQSTLAWYCTGAISLGDAAPSGAGTITVAGLFRGFSGELMAVTGGTGAYAGANGTVVLTVEGERFVRTITLTK